ncbi:MAG TPA: hypothetical protein VJJ82_02465 [Candidatus Nanoarchaeia archaeon]|nr:hypothetical protein [Candidatus Nanoarchaeia archaeon]
MGLEKLIHPTVRKIGTTLSNIAWKGGLFVGAAGILARYFPIYETSSVP